MIIETSPGQATKQGGNVASMLCTADGKVIHALAGPVTANELIYGIRWASNARETLEQAAGRQERIAMLQRFHSQAQRFGSERGLIEQGPGIGLGLSSSITTHSTAIHNYLAANSQMTYQAMGTHLFQNVLNEPVDGGDTPLVQLDRVLLDLGRTYGLVLLVAHETTFHNHVVPNYWKNSRERGTPRLNVRHALLQPFPLMRTTNESLVNALQRQGFEVSPEAQAKQDQSLFAISDANGQIIFYSNRQEELEARFRVELSMLIDRTLQRSDLSAESEASAVRLQRILERVMSPAEKEWLDRRTEASLEAEAAPRENASQPISALDRYSQ